MASSRYPIYRIPTGPTLKDLDACFLTYHSLHTPLTGNHGTLTLCLTFSGINIVALAYKDSVRIRAHIVRYAKIISSFHC